MKHFTAISLFSGAGGMDYGFQEAGFQIKLANELDKNAANSFMANYSQTPLLIGDINNFYPVFKDYKEVDVVFGGPPCQGFSVIGKMDPADKRSELIWSFLRVVSITTPKAFVMENVKALATLTKWENVRKKIVDDAHKLGYGCVPFVVNAAEYGTPQKRERVFFIGIKGVYDFEAEIWDLITCQKRKAPVLRELFKDLGPAGSESNPKTCNAKITFAVNPVIRKNPYDCLFFNGIGRAIDPDGYSRTLTASQGGNMTLILDEEHFQNATNNNWVKDYHSQLINGTITPKFEVAPERLRRMTINEARRIQTFPDSYTFCGPKTSVYKQIGNAVPCEMAKTIATALSKYLIQNNI